MESEPSSLEEKPKKRTFGAKLEVFLKRNKVALSAVYLMTMVVSGTLLVLVNNPNLMAGTENGYPREYPPAINALLWSFIAVATFLFVLGVVYVLSRRKRGK